MDSALAKLGRAQDHRDDLVMQIEEWRRRDPWKITADAVIPDDLDELERGIDLIEFKVRVREQVPAAWGLIIGDILTNLRAALDHAVYHHVTTRHQDLLEDFLRNLYFPVFDLKCLRGLLVRLTRRSAPTSTPSTSQRSSLRPATRR
jgi:hypothetical protein